MPTNQTPQTHNYLSFQKQFSPYKWYKPLLVTLATLGFFFVMMLVLTIFGTLLAANQGYEPDKLFTSGYDNLNTYSPLGALLSLGGIAIGIPALALGNRVVNARPFSSYSSSRGGFRFGVFAKCFGAALVLVALPLVLISVFTDQNSGIVRFSVLGFIMCTVLAPLQCAAEEYIFRGHIMQMFGAWIKFPVIPILLQTFFFAAAHPYNVTGVISVGLMGVFLGVCAYVTNGLEASCALHITNNLSAFYLTGFGFGSVKTEVDVIELVIVAVVCCLYLAFIIFADKKLGWFNGKKSDGVAEFNAKIAAK